MALKYRCPASPVSCHRPCPQLVIPKIRERSDFQKCLRNQFGSAKLASQDRLAVHQRGQQRSGSSSSGLKSQAPNIYPQSHVLELEASYFGLVGKLS